MGCYFWNVWTVSSSVTPLAGAYPFTYTQTHTWTCSRSLPASHSPPPLHKHTHTHNVPGLKLVPLTGYQSGNRGEKRRRAGEAGWLDLACHSQKVKGCPESPLTWMHPHTSARAHVHPHTHTQQRSSKQGQKWRADSWLVLQRERASADSWVVLLASAL